MKTLLNAAVLGLSATLLVGSVGITGCASTPNSRSTGRYVDDASITAKVKTDLYRDPMVKGHEINVDTYRGRVQLNGFVDNRHQANEAVKIARQVEGVVDVTNNLQIRGEAAGAARY